MSYRKNWKEHKLDDLANILNHKRIPLNTRQRKKRQGKYPYYGASGIVDYIDDYLFDGEHVLISEDGENLKSRKTPIAFKADGKFWVNNHAHILKGKSQVLNNFIVYYFKNLDLNAYITGAVQPKLNKQNLLSIPIYTPPNETLNKIIFILSAFDEKIKVNRQINATLEAMAQAMFREKCLPKDGEVLEEGWEKKKIGDLVKIKHGFAFKGKFFSKKPTNNILLTPGNFKIGGGFTFKKQKYYDGKIPEDYILSKGHLIVTMTDLSKNGDTLGYSALVPKIDKKTLLHNQRLGKVIYKVDEPVRMFLSWLMRSYKYRSIIVGSASGSTVKHTSPTKIQDFEFALPPNEILVAFEEFATNLWELQHNNFQENLELAKTRDLLLLKLMSGEIEV